MNQQYIVSQPRRSDEDIQKFTGVARVTNLHAFLNRKHVER